MSMALLTALLTSFPTTALAATKYGAAVTLKEPVTPTVAVNLPVNQEVLLEGRIKQVCQQKGCWMEISDEKTSLRVTFKDYGFFVPKDGAGRSVLAQGRLTEKEESIATQRHYLKDAGASQAEIDAVKTPRKVKSFVASGVQIRP